MDHITPLLLSYVLTYHYVAIFFITFLGALAFPIPSSTIVIASAAFTTQGYFSLPLVIITAIIGNVTGDNCSYWLSRKYGIPVLHFFGVRRVVSSQAYRFLGQEIRNHPILTIYFSRFLAGIAPAVNILSGLTKLTYKKFLTFEILGEITEVCFFSGIGYAFGANWNSIEQFSFLFWLTLCLLVTCAYLLIKFTLRKALFSGR